MDSFDQTNSSKQPTVNGLKKFYDFVGELLSSDTPVTPERAMRMWQDRLDTIHSVRKSTADVKAGRVRPAKELFLELSFDV